MGTIKQGILGGFSGKVGTVVGSSWKGISYMRGQAQSVKNPRTAKQMAQRDKFSLALPMEIQKQNVSGQISVSWADNSGTANALDTDFAMLLAYNAEKQEAVYDMHTACRGDEGVGVSYPADWSGDTVHIYLAFVSEDGTLVSDSEYVGSETIA